MDKKLLPPPRLLDSLVNRYFLLTLGISLLLAALLSFLLNGGLAALALCWGWGLAVMNALLAVFLNHRAVASNSNGGFMGWFLVKLLRMLVIVLCLGCFKLAAGAQFLPFLAAFLASYFCFMISEIAVLSLRESREDQA